MKYLGIDPVQPKVGVFDFTCCEGCQLQLANKEETLVPFLKAIQVVNFREISTDASDDYEVALVEGSISRSDEVERLEHIRSQAKVLVALGSCACFGGVNKLKNACNLKKINRQVYGDKPKDTQAVRPIHEVVEVDLKIPGCPVNKDEVERIVQHLVWGVPFKYPTYPVCLECKQRYTVCAFEQGHLCLGPVTQGGCNAPCPAGRLGCWGCRGPAPEANLEEFISIARERGFDDALIAERFNFFGGFEVTL